MAAQTLSTLELGAADHAATSAESAPAVSGGEAGDGAEDGRLDDLAQIIAAYNQVTDRLQHSHESLQAQVERLQGQLASTDAQLQRSRRLAALGEMAAGIAHEIRNPLAAIQLYAGMLVEDLGALLPRPLGEGGDKSVCDDPGAIAGETARGQTLGAAADTAAKIADAVRGLNAIVCDVLSFAREIKPRPVQVSAATLFGRALDAQQPAIKQFGITVRRSERSAGSDGELTLTVDRELMHQALVNLLRNAIDAMAGLPPQQQRLLTLGAEQRGSQVVLTVADTGPGIDDDAIDRIFNPFFTTRDTGTGLGLAIVHRIIDAHSGAITVHNDRGAVFTLCLPRIEC